MTNAAAKLPTLPAVSCEDTVTMIFRRKSEQFRVFSLNPCSAGRSSEDMIARGWEPMMYGCERIVTGRKTAKAVVLAYRSPRANSRSRCTAKVRK